MGLRAGTSLDCGSTPALCTGELRATITTGNGGDANVLTRVNAGEFVYLDKKIVSALSGDEGLA